MMSNEDDYSDAEVKEHKDLIILWMMEYGSLDKNAAQEKLENANIIYTDSGKYSMRFFHEEPYFWAMSILIGLNDIDWYQDKDLWPPTKEYRILEEKYDRGEIII